MFFNQLIYVFPNVFHKARYTKYATELALLLEKVTLAERLFRLTMESHKCLFIAEDWYMLDMLKLSQKIAKLK